MPSQVTPFPKQAGGNTELAALLERSQRAFREAPWPSLKVRRQRLKTLKKLLLANQEALIEAINADYGMRSRNETLLGELMPSVAGINHALAHLGQWLRPSRRSLGLHLQPGSAQVQYQPLGVVGIMAPWNYPLFLAMGPLTAALAAGNHVLLKLSEHTPATSALLARLIGEHFEPELVSVVEGDAKTAVAFSKLPFDHLLFTGATAIGHQVMRAASEHLTPVTLELGGKSPVIVAPDMPLERAASRILFGKAFNAGQTCVAPDYVLLPRGKARAFAEAMLARFQARYPDWRHNNDYSSIINGRQYGRLQGYLAQASEAGVAILGAGEGDELHRRLGLQLLLNPPSHLAVMQEEIFGPLLPVIEYDDLDEAVAFVQDRPKPLALYLFSHDGKTERRLLGRIRAGGVCVNETLLHVAVDDLPFGGVGHSGMGQYHGHEGFLTFSHARSLVRKGRLSSTALVYPPYKGRLLKLLSAWQLR
ncbi:coniferyl aldehyde dehydrogenase [Gallaecimonas sp. GXIMD4217]|uniref:coniferyl aldehyde dehydrogenase n=1 Tax=Gallaecimonas sp. GXIMD4217 TaxID=3131927 RepID=UPI00311AC606